MFKRNDIIDIIDMLFMILLRNFHLKANSASISTVKYRNNDCVFICINECLTNTEKARSAGQCCLQVYLLWCNRSLRGITISSFSHWVGQVGGRLPPQAQTLKIPPSVGCSPPPPLCSPTPKNWVFPLSTFPNFMSPAPTHDCRPHIGKNVSLIFAKNFDWGLHFQEHNHDLFEKTHWN